jgi:hypothetical protein
MGQCGFTNFWISGKAGIEIPSEIHIIRLKSRYNTKEGV